MIKLLVPLRFFFSAFNILNVTEPQKQLSLKGFRSSLEILFGLHLCTTEKKHILVRQSCEATQYQIAEAWPFSKGCPASYYPQLSETTDSSIFLFERLMLLPDIQHSTEVLTLTRHLKCFITHTSYFHTSSFIFFLHTKTEILPQHIHQDTGLQTLLFQLGLFRIWATIIL